MLQSIDWKLEYDSLEFEEFTADWHEEFIKPFQVDVFRQGWLQSVRAFWEEIKGIL